MRTLLILLSLFTITNCSTVPKNTKTKIHDSFKNEIFLLGVPHLSSFKLNNVNEVVSKTNETLENWGPTVICVEARTPTEAQEMVKKKNFFPEFNRLYKHFSHKGYDLGAKLKNKKSYEEVEHDILKVLAKNSLKDKDRIFLVKNYLHNLNIVNATYQYSQLKNKSLARKLLNKDTNSLLLKNLSSNNEIYSIALPLAKKLNHRSICLMDSHRNGTELYKAPKKTFDSLFNDPARENYLRSAIIKEYKKIDSMFESDQDLIRSLEFYNSSNFRTSAHEEWTWLKSNSSGKGLAKVYFMGWELRNMNMATNILSASQKPGKQKTLVIVGAAHGHSLEKILKESESTDFVPFKEIFKK